MRRRKVIRFVARFLRVPPAEVFVTYSESGRSFPVRVTKDKGA